MVCIIGPIMTSGQMAVRSKPGLLFCIKSQAAFSASFFDTLYPRIGSFFSIAWAAVTCVENIIIISQDVACFQEWTFSIFTLTGFQSFSVYGFPGFERSSKEFSISTALARRTKRLKVNPPCLFALLRMLFVLFI